MHAKLTKYIDRFIFFLNCLTASLLSPWYIELHAYLDIYKIKSKSSRLPSLKQLPHLHINWGYINITCKSHLFTILSFIQLF